MTEHKSASIKETAIHRAGSVWYCAVRCMAEGACEGIKAKNTESVEGDGVEVEMWVGGVCM